MKSPAKLKHYAAIKLRNTLLLTSSDRRGNTFHLYNSKLIRQLKNKKIKDVYLYDDVTTHHIDRLKSDIDTAKGSGVQSAKGTYSEAANYLRSLGFTVHGHLNTMDLRYESEAKVVGKHFDTTIKKVEENFDGLELHAKLGLAEGTIAKERESKYSKLDWYKNLYLSEFELQEKTGVIDKPITKIGELLVEEIETSNPKNPCRLSWFSSYSGHNEQVKDISSDKVEVTTELVDNREDLKRETGVSSAQKLGGLLIAINPTALIDAKGHIVTFLSEQGVTEYSLSIDGPKGQECLLMFDMPEKLAMNQFLLKLWKYLQDKKIKLGSVSTVRHKKNEEHIVTADESIWTPFTLIPRPGIASKSIFLKIDDIQKNNINLSGLLRLYSFDKTEPSGYALGKKYLFKKILAAQDVRKFPEKDFSNVKEEIEDIIDYMQKQCLVLLSQYKLQLDEKSSPELKKELDVYFNKLVGALLAPLDKMIKTWVNSAVISLDYFPSVKAEGVRDLFPFLNKKLTELKKVIGGLLNFPEEEITEVKLSVLNEIFCKNISRVYKSEMREVSDHIILSSFFMDKKLDEISDKITGLIAGNNILKVKFTELLEEEKDTSNPSSATSIRAERYLKFLNEISVKKVDTKEITKELSDVMSKISWHNDSYILFKMDRKQFSSRFGTDVVEYKN